MDSPTFDEDTLPAWNCDTDLYLISSFSSLYRIMFVAFYPVPILLYFDVQLLQSFEAYPSSLGIFGFVKIWLLNIA